MSKIFAECSRDKNPEKFYPLTSIGQKLVIILFSSEIRDVPAGCECSEFRESERSLKHEMGWIYKGSACYLCLSGTAIVCWFLTEEIVGLNTILYENILEFLKILQHSIRKILQWSFACLFSKQFQRKCGEKLQNYIAYLTTMRGSRLCAQQTFFTLVCINKTLIARPVPEIHLLRSSISLETKAVLKWKHQK